MKQKKKKKEKKKAKTGFKKYFFKLINKSIILEHIGT